MKRTFLILLAALLFLSGCAAQDAEFELNGGSAILAPEVQTPADNNQQQDVSEPELNQPQEQQPDQTPADEQPSQDQQPSQEQPPSQKEEPEAEQTPSDEPQEQQPSAGDNEPQQEEPKDEPQQEQPKEHPWIKVCSYNVQKFHYDEVTYYIGSPMSKFDAVCAELRKINADIVGLQELERYSEDAGGADADQLKLVAEELGYPYYYFTKTANLSGGRSEYGHGIMSRYPIKESKDYHFYEFYCDASEPRAFSRSVIDVNGTELIFYNSHLAGPVVQQFEVIAKMMAEDKANGYYAVYTADNNAHPHEMQPVANGTILLNTVENPIITSHWQGQPTNPIDNVVITDNFEYYWDEQNKTGIKTFKTTASDHLPVYTEIRFKG